jgi:hypothetical protein
MTWTWKNEWNKITVIDGIIKWGRKRKMRQWLFFISFIIKKIYN